jgi:hypothetical protein
MNVRAALATLLAVGAILSAGQADANSACVANTDYKLLTDGNVGSATTLTLTLGATGISIGDRVCVFAGGRSSIPPTGAADSGAGSGNTYVATGAIPGLTFRIGVFCTTATVAVPSGGTITVSAGTATTLLAAAVKLTTAGSVDQHGSGANNSNNNPLISTTTLAQATEVVLAYTFINNSDLTLESTGFATVDTVVNAPSSTLVVSCSKTSATTLVAYSSTTSGSSSWVANYDTFAASGGGSPATPPSGLSMRGAGE